MQYLVFLLSLCGCIFGENLHNEEKLNIPTGIFGSEIKKLKCEVDRKVRQAILMKPGSAEYYELVGEIRGMHSAIKMLNRAADGCITYIVEIEVLDDE